MLEQLAATLQPEDTFQRSLDARILKIALEKLREGFQPAKIAAGRTLSDKKIEQALRAGFREVDVQRRPASGRDIERFVEPFTAFIREQQQAMGLVGAMPAASARAPRTSKATPQSADQLANRNPRSLGGMHGLLEGRLPRDPDQRERFAQEFASATGYALDRFLRWGTVRDRPHEMSAAEWEGFVAARLEAGHPEDVVVEPRQTRALNAALPAFLFLREKGIVTDPLDYLAAVYPLFGELLAQARSHGSNGGLRIEGPLLKGISSMADLTYEQIARRVKDERFPTLILAPTLHQHASGHVHHPLYQNVQRQAAALAASEHASPERARAIYLFLAAMPRIREVLHRTTLVYSADGRLISDPLSGLTGMPQLHLVDNEARYPTGFKPPTTNRRQTLQLDVQRKTYSALLALMQRHLDQLATIESGMGIPLTITMPDGTVSSVEELRNGPEGAAAAAGRMAEMDALLFAERDMNPAEMRQIEQYYDGLRAFADRLFFYARVSGEMPSALGPVPFVAAARIEGRQLQAPHAALLFVSDLADLATGDETRGQWEPDRIRGLMRLRIYAQEAIERGTLRQEDLGDANAVATATQPFLLRPFPGWEETARDFIRLEQHPIELALRETTGSVHAQRRATAAAILERIRAGGEPGVETPRPAASPALEEWVGNQAAQQYASLFPRSLDATSRLTIDSPVPLDDRLLQLVVEIAAESSPNANRDLAMHFARQSIEIYNRRHEAPALPPAPAAARIPETGLLEQRLAIAVHQVQQELGNGPIAFNRDVVWHAAFLLRPRIVAGQSVGDEEIRDAVAAVRNGTRTNGNEPLVLARLVAGQQRDLAAWRALVEDPQSGIAAFVSGRYTSSYLTGEAMAGIALRIIAERFTSARPVDAQAIAMEMLGDAFVPHADIARKMAGSAATILGRWMQEVVAGEIDARLTAIVNDGREAIEVIAGDTREPAATLEQLTSRAAELAGFPSFADLERAQGRLALIREVMAGTSPGEPLATTARRLFEQQSLPAVEARRSEMAREAQLQRAAKQKELEGIVQRAADLAERSASVFVEPADISRLDDKEVVDFISRAQASFDLLTGLTDEVSAFSGLRGRAAHLAQELGSGMEVIDQIREDVMDSREQIHRAADSIVEAIAAADARRTELTRLRDAARVERESREIEAEATTLVATLQAEVAAIDALRQGPLAEQRARGRATINVLRSDAAFHHGAMSEAARATEGIILLGRQDARRLDEIRGRLQSWFEPPAGMPDAIPAAMRISSRLVGAMDAARGDRWRELAATAERLTEAVNRARAAQGAATEARDAIATRERDLSQAVDAAELAMPIGPAAGIPEPRTADFSRNAGISLAAETPEREPHTRAQHLLDSLLFSHILIARGESRLLTRPESAAVERWIADGRPRNLTVRDAFGNVIELARGERGNRLARHTALPDDHPFHRILNTLAVALMERSSEAALLAAIARQGLKDRTPQRALLLDLLATLAAAPSVGTGEEARAIVRRWAVAQQRSIAAALKGAAESFFVRSEPVAHAAETHLRPATYTKEEHHGSRQRFATLLEHPEVGALIVKTPDASRRLFHVDVAETAEHLSTGTTAIRILDLDQNTWSAFPLRENGVTSIDQLMLERQPIGLQPERLEMMRLLYRIHSEPLYDLGWLASISTDAESPTYHMANSTLMTIARSQLTRGPAPMTLRLAQQEMRAAFRELSIGASALPEVERVRSDVLENWIEQMSAAKPGRPAAEASVIARTLQLCMAKSDIVRRMFARLFFALEWSTSHRRDHDAAAMREAYFQVEELMLTHREQRETALATFMLEPYVRIRPLLLEDRELMQLATGLHAPELVAPFVAPDEELARRFPEIELVGASQLWSIMAALRNEKLQTPPGLLRLFEIFPRYANAICMIAATHEQLSPRILRNLEDLAHSYDRHGGFRDTATIAAFERRFFQLYGENADAILRALETRQAEGMSLARWLTGSDHPRDAATAEQRLSPLERLHSVAPEFARFPEKHVEPILTQLEKAVQSTAGAIDQDVNPVRSMLAFAAQHPEFRHAIALLGLLLERLPKDLRYQRIFPFFTLEDGPWNKPSAAADFVQLITDPAILREVRKAEQKPLPGHNGPSIARAFLGSETPWLPDVRIAPSSPEGVTSALPPREALLSLTNTELSKLVEDRLAANGFLQKPRSAHQRQELDQRIFLWREREAERAAQGKDAVVLAGDSLLQRTFVKVMLAAEKCSPELMAQLRGLILSSIETRAFSSDAEILAFAYTFLEGAAADQNLPPSGRKGGGGSSAPPAAPASGGSAPPAPPAPAAPAASAVASPADASADAVGDRWERSGATTSSPEPSAEDAAAAEAMEAGGMEVFGSTGMTALNPAFLGGMPVMATGFAGCGTVR